MTEIEARIAKFKRRAKDVSTPAHLQKIMASFPEDRHAEIIEKIKPSLKPELCSFLPPSQS